MYRYIELDDDNIVVSVIQSNSEMDVDGYELSLTGEVGQKRVNDEFIDVPVEPQPPVETMEEKIVQLEQLIQEQNLTQMEVLATIYEEILGGA